MLATFTRYLAALGLSALVSSAHALVTSPPPGTYNFSGICLDCDEVPSPANATLVIGNTWSFSYESNLWTLTSDWVEVANLGEIDAEGNADAFVLFGAEGETWEFMSSTTGSWSLNMQSIDSVNEDFGRDGVWRASNRVPEPATYALIALGVLAGAARRRSTAR